MHPCMAMPTIEIWIYGRVSLCIRKYFPSISYILPMDIIHYTKHGWFGKPRTFNMNSNILPLPWLDQSPGQARHHGPRFFGVFSWVGTLASLANKELTIDSKKSSFFFAENSTASPVDPKIGFPHIVLRTPSSSDQVWLSWARWRSCTFMSFTWTVAFSVAIAAELTKKKQDAS